MHLPAMRPFRFGALVELISAGPRNPLGKKKACGETLQAFFDLGETRNAYFMNSLAIAAAWGWAKMRIRATTSA